MIGNFISFLEHTLVPLGAQGIFFASIIEEVVAPIPSAVVQMLGGFLFLQGPFSLDLLFKLVFFVVLPAALGVALGSLFIYTICYFAGKPVLLKWGKWLGVSWDDVEKLQGKFEGNKLDEYALFLVRTIPIVPSVAVSAFCGLIRFNVFSYLVWTFFGTCLRATLLAILGWQVGAVYFKFAHVISKVENVVFVLLFLCIIFWIVYRLIKK